MKMDEKKLQTLAEELNSFSANTLKYCYWTVSKLCTVIELSSDKEGVEYKLQPRNEERDTKNGAPTPEQEAAIMQGLQKKGFFGFQSALVGADKPIIFGGEHGLTGEAAMRMANDPRSNLERKYEWGWLENPDLDALQSYLATISSLIDGNRPRRQGKMVFNIKTGQVSYVGLSGKKYQDKFGVKSNPYLLLRFLSQNPGDIFDSNVLATHYLNKPKAGGEDSTDDRRVRDTVGTIREKLGLTTEDDLFIVDKGFGLKCDVELKT